jgi:hypothetical protein
LRKLHFHTYIGGRQRGRQRVDRGKELREEMGGERNNRFIGKGKKRQGRETAEERGGETGGRITWERRRERDRAKVRRDNG